jgi:hypothetical protein
MTTDKLPDYGINNWDQVAADLQAAEVPLQYKAIFNHGLTPVSLIIDMDPGGGFEGGFEFTSLSAPVPVQFTSLKADIPGNDPFRFALHEEGFIDKVGKFFGMEDIEIGYEEFDKNIIVKSNDKDKVRAVFADPKVRQVFQTLSDFTIQLSKGDDEDSSTTL